MAEFKPESGIPFREISIRVGAVEFFSPMPSQRNVPAYFQVEVRTRVEMPLGPDMFIAVVKMIREDDFDSRFDRLVDCSKLEIKEAIAKLRRGESLEQSPGAEKL